MIPHTLVTSALGQERSVMIQENCVTLASDQTLPLLALVITWQQLHNTELRSEVLPQSLWKVLTHPAVLCSGNKALGSFLVLKWGDEFSSGPVGKRKEGQEWKDENGWKDASIEQGNVLYYFTGLMCSSLGSMWMWLGMHRSDTQDRYRLRSGHFLWIGYRREETDQIRYSVYTILCYC